jgi:hypothetical protein
MNITNNIIDYVKEKIDISNFLGYELTNYQIDVLTKELDDNSYITKFDFKNRQSGTSLALLLRVYKQVFVDNKNNCILIISRSNIQSEFLRKRFVYLLEKSGQVDRITKSNKYSIVIDNKINIRFTNNNENNLRGIKDNQTIFIDDYTNEGDCLDDMLIQVLLSSLPEHIYILCKKMR